MPLLTFFSASAEIIRPKEMRFLREACLRGSLFFINLNKGSKTHMSKIKIAKALTAATGNLEESHACVQALEEDEREREIKV